MSAYENVQTMMAHIMKCPGVPPSFIFETLKACDQHFKVTDWNMRDPTAPAYSQVNIPTPARYRSLRSPLPNPVNPPMPVRHARSMPPPHSPPSHTPPSTPPLVLSPPASPPASPLSPAYAESETELEEEEEEEYEEEPDYADHGASPIDAPERVRLRRQANIRLDEQIDEYLEDASDPFASMDEE